jgi:hypothetical protein
MKARAALAALALAAASTAACGQPRPILGTCAPKDLQGTGTKAVTELNKVGVAVGWWCPGANQPRLYAVRWNAATQELHEAMQTLRDSTDPATAIAAVSNAQRNVPIASLQDVWQPMHARLMAARPVEAWVVAPAASNANPPNTRPVFAWTGTPATRGGVVSGARATAGTDCDPAVGRIEGSSAYYGVNGRPDQVALCVRR